MSLPRAAVALGGNALLRRGEPLEAASQAHAARVETLVLATDVDAVYDRYGTDEQRPIVRATPAALRDHDFPAGSTGPKVEAVCRFVERTGGRAVIGSLDQVRELLGGHAGTQVVAQGPGIEYAERGAGRERAA